MPTYTVDGPDGTTYEIEGPAGATDEEVIAAVQQELAKERRAELDKRIEDAYNVPSPTIPEESSVLGNIVKGVPAGAIGLLESAALGAATLLDEDTEKSARDIIKDVADAVKPRLANPDDVSAKLAQGVGSILGLAPALLAGPAALPLAAGISGAAGAGEASERARAKDATEEERSKAAALGILPGLLDVIPFGRMARSAGVAFDTPIIGDLVDKIGPQTLDGIKSRIQRAAATGGIEAAQEAAQNVAQNLIEQGYSPDTATFGGTLEEGLIGGGSGAIVQGLIDLALGRRARGATTGEPTDPEQGELFPGQDLGTPPTPVGPEQGELFPTEDLGRAPERTDDRQPDLFDTPTSQAGVLRQRIRDLELERQRIINSPIAPFEETGDPFLERTKAEIDQARAQLAELESRTGPQQRELPFEDVPGSAAEQSAQAAAREREGVRAAERGDTEAFEQPDLFALQQEQERGRLGPEELRRSDQFMDVPEAAAPTTAPDTRQTDIEEQIELQRMLDQDSERQAAADRVAGEVVAASELETIAGQQETARQAATSQRRNTVLASVLDNLSTASRANVGRRFSKALADAGIADTAPTAAELRTIARATDAFAAGRPAPVVEETAPEAITGSPEATQLGEMEARIPERRTDQRVPEQPSFPGMGRRGTAPTESAEPTVEPRILNEETLNELAIPKTAPVRKRVTGKDFNQPEVRQQLVDFANNPRTSKTASLNIDRLVRGTPEEQGDLFAPRRGSARRTAAEPRDISPETEVADGQLSLFGDTIAVSDVKPARSGRGVPPAVRKEPKRKQLGDTAGTITEADAGRLGTAASNIMDRLRGEGGPRTPLTPIPATKRAQRTGERKTKPKIKSVKPVQPKRTAAEPAKKPVTKKVSKPTDKPDETKQGLFDRWKKSASAAVQQYVLAIASDYQNALPTSLRDTPDPTTQRDRSAVLDLLTGKAPKTKAARAAKIFFSKHPDVATALHEIAYAAVLAPKVYRRGEGETDVEAEYFKGMGQANARDALVWVEQNMSDSTNKWTRALLDDNHRSQQIITNNTQGDRVQTARTLKGLEEDNFNLPGDAIAHLGMMNHPGVMNALRANDLGSALRIMAKTTRSDRIAQVARKLSKVIGDTKVEVVDTLESADGRSVAGLFDPKTNTIKISGRMPSENYAHTLLHEATHAATSSTLANKNHPVTKQLTKLFNDVKDSIENYYGSQSVDEFVSEVFSNPEFQAELAQLNESGKRVSALQRFMNIVGNFLRRMIGMQVKPIKSALTAADSMIESILSVAPQSREANQLFMDSKFGDYKKALDGALDGLPPMTKAGAKRVLDLFNDSNIGMNIKKGVMYLLPVHAATEIASKYIPVAEKLNDIIRRQSGVLDKGARAIDGVVESLSSWGKTNPEKRDIFNELVVLSTTEQVDPELSREQARKKYKGDAERMQAWEDAKRMYNEIGEGGRTQYKTLRNTYKSLLNDIKKSLQKRIKDEVGTSEGSAIFDKINERLLKNGVIDPYFPLHREGSYWVSYNAKNPRTGQQDYFVEAFESKSAAKDAIAKLKADNDVDTASINEYTNQGQIDYKNAPPSSFVNDILKILEANGLSVKKNPKDPDTAADQVIRLYLDAIPERSMLQGFRQRKGTAGARKDAVLALKRKGHSIVRQMAQIEFGKEIQGYRDEIDAYVSEQKQRADVGIERSELLDMLQNDLDQRAQFAASPNISNWSKTATSMGFNFTLGLNISSALVNLTAVPMIVAPYLGGKYGYKDTMQAMASATKMFMGSGTQRRVETYGPDGTEKVSRNVKARWSLDNYDFDAANTPPEIKMRRALAEVAAEQGMLNRSITQDVLDMEGMGDTVSEKMQKFNSVSGFLFHHGERMQRQVTLDMAYQLELSKRTGVALDDLGQAYKAGRISDADMEAAAREAVYITELTNGGVAAAGAPRIAQNDIGRIAYMFKRYAVSMYYLMGQLADKSVRGSAEDKAMARKQLAGIFGATGILAGVGGMPLFGALSMIANMFLDDDEEDFQTMTRQYLGEGMYGGAVNYIFGVDVASRIGLSDMIFRNSLIAKDQSVFWTLIEELGGPVVGIGLSAERGLDMISEGNVSRGLEAMMPASIRNTMKGLRFGTEGAQTLRGDSIVDDIGVGHSLGQVLGFAPSTYTRQLMENAALKKIDRSVAKDRTDILRKLYVARRHGDRSGIKDAMESLRRFNRRHPSAAITGETIIRSMKSHMKTTREMHHGVTLNKNMRAVLANEAREFDKNVSIWD